MPKIDLASIEQTNRTGYPEPYAAAMAKRWYRRLAPAAGLTDFGVSHVTLRPGGISSQRHWHEGEDEFVVMLSGEAVLVEDDGETVMTAGDCAAFRKGVANGHHLVNRSGRDCVFIAVGKLAATDCHYPDIDLLLDGATNSFVHKDGTSYSAADS
ncbi:MAG TPA: cupin domain-containing protein [Allosphingosinicella sp.]|nr:cupin domain-containing protein [Allosphingosinicella sp.]